MYIKDHASEVLAGEKKMKLVKGQKYDVAALKCVGWTQGDGSGHEGYRFSDYFDADGTYRGADTSGIEPVVEAS